MAYNTKNTSHGYELIENDLKLDGFAGVCTIILEGTELYFVDHYKEKLAEIFLADGAQAFDRYEIDHHAAVTDEIREATLCLPLLSTRRVIILKNIPVGEQALGTEDMKALAKLIPTIADNAFLILCFAGEASKRSAIYKAVAASGKAYRFGRLDEALCERFIRSKFKDLGAYASPEITKLVLRSSGYIERDSECDLYKLSSDIAIIAAYAAPSAEASSGEAYAVGAAHVEACMGVHADTDIFVLLDAISAGKKGEAMEMASLRAEDDGSVFSLLGSFISQFELMHSYKELKQRGDSLSLIESTLSVHAYRLKKAAAFADRIPADRLASLLSRLFRIDADIKTGLYDQQLALQMFIAEM